MHPAVYKVEAKVLQSMQQQFDSVSEQLNNIKDQLGAWVDMSISKKDPIALPKIKSIGCQCLFCDHHNLKSYDSPVRNQDNSLFNGLSGDEVEGGRVSDTKTTSELEDIIRTKNMRIKRLKNDILVLKQEKIIAKLKDIIRTKNTTITRLKKGVLVQEHKVANLTRFRRQSNMKTLPKLVDNPLLDMDSKTSLQSSDSNCPLKNPVAETHNNVVSVTSSLKLGREYQVLERQSNTKQIPAMVESPLFNMKSTSSPLSSDSDCLPTIHVPRTHNNFLSKKGKEDQVSESMPPKSNSSIYSVEQIDAFKDVVLHKALPLYLKVLQAYKKWREPNMEREGQVLQSMQQKPDSRTSTDAKIGDIMLSADARRVLLQKAFQFYLSALRMQKEISDPSTRSAAVNALLRSSRLISDCF